MPVRIEKVLPLQAIFAIEFKIRNPKLEIRNKYEIQMFQGHKQRNGVKILRAYRNVSGIRILVI
jgi:hypothetical protein